MSVATTDKTVVCCNKMCGISWCKITRQMMAFLQRWQLYNKTCEVCCIQILISRKGQFHQIHLKWRNNTIFGEKLSFLVHCETEYTSEKDIFSLYLLCLIPEREQQKWLMDQNIDFSKASLLSCTMRLCERRAGLLWSLFLRDCPLTGTMK